MKSEMRVVTSGEVFKRGIFAVALLVCALVKIASAAESQSEWESTLAAAKKEGKVAVITDVTAAIRDALTMPFQEKYGIPVELFGALGREVPPRIARGTQGRPLPLGCVRSWHHHRTRVDDSHGSVRSFGAGSDFARHQRS